MRKRVQIWYGRFGNAKINGASSWKCAKGSEWNIQVKFLQHDVKNNSYPRFALKECEVYAGEFAEDSKPMGKIIDNYCKTTEFNHIVFKDDCKSITITACYVIISRSNQNVECGRSFSSFNLRSKTVHFDPGPSVLDLIRIFSKFP